MYACLSSMRVQGANMMSSLYAATPANPMGMMLFAHALAERCGAKLKRAAFVFHDIQPLGDQGLSTFYPQQKRGASLIDMRDYANKDALAQSSQPNVCMNMTISVVIEFEGEPVGLTDQLVSMRFLGGEIIRVSQVSQSHALDELRIPYGFWLVDRSDLVEVDRPLDSMIEAVTLRKASWLVWGAVGYALTTEPIEARGVRSGPRGETLEHAFCEPMLGAVQFISARQLKQLTQEIPFWSMEWATQEIFLAKNAFSTPVNFVSPTH